MSLCILIHLCFLPVYSSSRLSVHARLKDERWIERGEQARLDLAVTQTLFLSCHHSKQARSSPLREANRVCETAGRAKKGGTFFRGSSLCRLFLFPSAARLMDFSHPGERPG